jgi:hypothetical protein
MRFKITPIAVTNHSFEVENHKTIISQKLRSNSPNLYQRKLNIKKPVPEPFVDHEIQPKFTYEKKGGGSVKPLA